MIRLENISKEYDKVVAVYDLTLQVDKGEVFGLIGPNGAGKTTTIRMIATLLEPTRGSVYINGINAYRYPLKVRALLGYVPDVYGMPAGLKVWEYLDYFGAAYGIDSSRREKRTAEVLELVNLSERRDSYVGILSRGMKQRLCIAKTLLHDPEVLLLDEPTSGLDPESRIGLKKILHHLQGFGKTVLISSHLLVDLSGFCTSLGIMEDGRLLEYGKVEDLKKKYHETRTIRMVVALGAEIIFEKLKNNPNILDFEIDGKEVTIRFKGGVEDMADLNARLNSEGIRIASFSEVEAEIEEIFIRVTDSFGADKS
jgi:ABC-2 type transport system ATP-binding protein